MSHAGILSEKEIVVFRRYVEGGGKLLITGFSGQFDRYGRPLEKSLLEDLIGGRVVRRLEFTDSWMRFRVSDSQEQIQRELCLGIPTDWPFLVRGPAVVYEPQSANAVGELLDSHRGALVKPESYNQDWPLSPREVVGPAVLVNQVGQGQVLTFAGSPDQAVAGEHHIVEVRKLFANAVRLLNPKPRVRVSGPANVEVVVTDDPSERVLRIHLIAYNPTPQTTPIKNRPYLLPGLIEDAPMFRVEIGFWDEILSLDSLGEGTRISLRDARAEVIVNDIHEIVLCRY